VKKKSKTPNIAPIAIETARTNMVSRVVSSREGHVTFFISLKTSPKKLNTPNLGLLDFVGEFLIALFTVFFATSI
jgi:hypothetical protein|tara:strand:+ start:154 stop:378 length:225 start_codon:yes stop_codon:yes gene_type:complete